MTEIEGSPVHPVRGDMRGFFTVQKANLENAIKFDIFWDLFSSLDEFYRYTLQVGKNVELARFVLITNKAFLTAASLIGQAQPDDSGPITRRAIEAVRVAAAIKDNPGFRRVWMDFEKRLARWQTRQRGEKPPRYNLEIPIKHPILHELADTWGILSDTSAHFTPEYFGTLDWEFKDGMLKLQYFLGDQRVMENAILLLTITHMKILQVLDYCLGGIPGRDREWNERLVSLDEKRMSYVKRFGERYPEQDIGTEKSDETSL